MRGFAPRKHPAPSLQPGLHRKTSFCFSASTCRQDSHTIHFAPAGNGLSPTAGRHLSGRFFTEHHTFRPQLPPARRQPANSLSPHIFLYQPSQPLASSQPSFRLDWPVYSRSHSFSLFLPFHSMPKKIEGNRQSRFSSIFLTIPNLVQI